MKIIVSGSLHAYIVGFVDLVKLNDAVASLAYIGMILQKGGEVRDTDCNLRSRQWRGSRRVNLPEEPVAGRPF